MDGKRPESGAERPAPAEGAASPQSVALLEGFARLFAVAAIYPATHVRVQSLAGPVLEGLREACLSRPSLSLEVRGGIVHVNGERVPASGAGAARLAQDLDALGVSRLEIEAEASLEDLLALSRLLRVQGQQKGGAARFQHAEVTGLPPTIRAIHQDFGAPTFDETRTAEEVGSGDLARLVEIAAATASLGSRAHSGHPKANGAPASSEGEAAARSTTAGTGLGTRRGPKASTSLSSGADAGGHGTLVDPQDPDAVSLEDMPSGEQIRALVGSILASATGAVPAGADMGALGRVPKGRREVLRSIAEALETAVDPLRGEVNAETVASIFEHAAHHLPKVAPHLPLERLMESLRVAIDEHLRDPFRREAVSTAGPGGGKVTRETVPTEWGVEELAARMDAFSDDRGDFGDFAAVDPAEYLGILLHALATAEGPALIESVTGRIGDVLRQDGEQALTVLTGWLSALLARGDAALLDQALGPILARLREASPASAADLVLAPLRPPQPEPLLLLWPHLVDLLLRGLDESDRRLEDEMIAALARLDSADMRPQASRLVEMPAVRAGALCRRLLQPPREDLYALYEVFLETRTAPHLGFQVLEAFFKYPPSTPASGVLTVLRAGEDRSRSFLGRILRENHGTGETPALRQLCASTIAESLRSLPARRRGEEWVVRAITALRHLPGPESVALARQILTEKRFGFLPAWPQAPRLAARMIEGRGQGVSPGADATPPAKHAPLETEASPGADSAEAARYPAEQRPGRRARVELAGPARRSA